jgi:ABC-type transporter MlaC component
MTEMHTLTTQLQALVEKWLAAVAERRSHADAEVNKVWSAEQYGVADILEDAAVQIQQAIQRLTQGLGDTVDWKHMTENWLSLSKQMRTLADADDNRLTVAYRRAGSETYLDVINEIRALLKETN